MSDAGDTGRSVLIALDECWNLWPTIGLRSAGMPAARVLELADDENDRGRTAARFVADPWFREAITWQNPTAVRQWMADYATRLQHGDDTLARRGQREAVIARYVQRYATKNDTIGFFGPLALATAAPEMVEPILVNGRGRQIVRRTRFEPWAITRMADRWGTDPEIRRQLRPRRDPSSVLAGDRLLRPRRQPVTLTEDEAAVLALCDGRSDSDDILRHLRQERPELGFSSSSEVLSILADLARRRWVLWGFHLPMDERTDEHLTSQLRDVAGPVADRHRRNLESLLAARAEVDAAAGDPQRLLDALSCLDRRYEEINDEPARRTKLQSSSGRGLLWLDTLVDWDVTIGRPLLDSLRHPLGMLLSTCRWLTWRVAEEIKAVAWARVRAAPRQRVPFAMLLAELAPELSGTSSHGLDRVVQEMQAVVRRILPYESGQRAYTTTASEVAQAWQREFSAPAPGWAAARVHSPDLMLAARNLDSVRRGEFRWVVGEVHVAVNTLDNRGLAGNHPNPEHLKKLSLASYPGPRYMPAFPPQWHGINARAYPTAPMHLADRYVYWSLEPEDVLPEHLPRLPSAGLEAVVVGDEVTVVDGAGFSAPLIEFIGELLSFLVVNAFHLFPRQDHVPRVTIDRVVVHRETWRFPVADLLRCCVGKDAHRRLGEHLEAAGVPRFFFVQLPGDSKPFYCDRNSAYLLRNVVRLLTADLPPDASVRLQEMMPGFDELWLGGEVDGARTSEFRLVAVDALGWPR